MLTDLIFFFLQSVKTFKVVNGFSIKEILWLFAVQ